MFKIRHIHEFAITRGSITASIMTRDDQVAYRSCKKENNVWFCRQFTYTASSFRFIRINPCTRSKTAQKIPITTIWHPDFFIFPMLFYSPTYFFSIAMVTFSPFTFHSFATAKFSPIVSSSANTLPAIASLFFSAIAASLSLPLMDTLI